MLWLCLQGPWRFDHHLPQDVQSVQEACQQQWENAPFLTTRTDNNHNKSTKTVGQCNDDDDEFQRHQESSDHCGRPTRQTTSTFGHHHQQYGDQNAHLTATTTTSIGVAAPGFTEPLVTVFHNDNAHFVEGQLNVRCGRR